MKTLSMILVLGVPALVQAQASCGGPGAAFGITAYECASCSAALKPDGRTEYTFRAEPAVLQAREGGPFKPGDVIVSVNDKPITTRAGADLFTYPDSLSRVQFRRARELVTLTFALRRSQSCSSGQAEVRDSALFTQLNAMVQTINGTGAKTGKFGFSLGCVPSCTRVKDEKGREYWRYDGHPTMQNITAGGPADRAGVKEGDLLLDVGEHSILTPEGALMLQRSDRLNVLTLTLRRADGQDAVYTLATKDAEKAFASPVRCEGTTVGIVENRTRVDYDVYGGGRIIGSARPGRSEFILPTGTRYLGFQRLTEAGVVGVRMRRNLSLTYQIICR